MERIKKTDEERKELKSGKNEVKIKKAKESTKLDKENEVEEEIEPVTLCKGKEERSSKKKEGRELLPGLEGRTVGVGPLTDHCENRGKRCRVSKML